MAQEFRIQGFVTCRVTQVAHFQPKKSLHEEYAFSYCTNEDIESLQTHKR